jgi:hypothetical protein
VRSGQNKEGKKYAITHTKGKPNRCAFLRGAREVINLPCIASAVLRRDLSEIAPAVMNPTIRRINGNSEEIAIV